MTLIQEFHLSHDKLNKELEKSVFDEMAHTRSTKEQHSNIGGWQSRRDLHTLLGDGSLFGNQLLELYQSFSSPMMEYIRSHLNIFHVKKSDNYDWNYSDSWLNVAIKGSYNAPHTHPTSQISAAYYVRTEAPPADYPLSGRIDFYFENISYSYFPKPATLILFPGNMIHFVHPYYGESPRICLSFNTKNIHAI